MPFWKKKEQAVGQAEGNIEVQEVETAAEVAVAERAPAEASSTAEQAVEVPTEVAEDMSQPIETAEEAITTSVEDPGEPVEVPGKPVEVVQEQHLDAADRSEHKAKAKQKKEDGPRDCSLYILVEKVQPNLGEYLESMGIYAKVIRSDVEDLKLDLMMEREGVRMLILEQGMGRFTTTLIRQDIQDLVGMCEGDTRMVTIFTTSGILKGDINKRTVGKAAAEIDWQGFFGIVSVINYLRGLSENYIKSEETVDETEMLPKLTDDDLLRLLPAAQQTPEEQAIERSAPRVPEYFSTENLFLKVGELQEKAGEHTADSEEEFDDEILPPVAVNY